VLGEKHFQPLPTHRFLQVTAPVQRTLARGRVEEAQPLQPAEPLTSAAFRRMTRRSGPLARRVAVATQQKLQTADEKTLTRHVQEGLGGLAVLTESLRAITGFSTDSVAADTH